MKLKNVLTLIKKDFLIEWKEKYVLGAILLFVVVSSYIIYKSFQQITPMSWNVLYWIIFLFAAINALIRSFSTELSRQYLYIYQLVKPGEIIIAKITYNVLVLLVVSLALMGAMSLFTIHPIENYKLFFLAVILGSIGVSVCFTFVASVLGQQAGQSVLMSVLSLPLIIPILLLLLKVTASSLGILSDTGINSDLILLAGIDLILFGVAVIIYPFLWRV
jgi:heme exporter protein B